MAIFSACSFIQRRVRLRDFRCSRTLLTASDSIRGSDRKQMLAKRIIPCLDVDRGRVVKGIRFLSLADAGDPLEQSKTYDLQSADELTFLDITASSDKREIIIELVRRVADEVFIPLTVGGGLRSVEDIRAVLRAGADKITRSEEHTSELQSLAY